MVQDSHVNLPNSLTLARIVLVPLLVVVLLTKFNEWELWGVSKELLAAGIFGIASLTDWADGYLARRRKQVTGLGQWMDPLADKLLVTAALVSLIQMDMAASWMVVIILGREFAVTLLRAVAHARGQALPASPIGKIKMAAQVVAILALILGSQGHEGLRLLGTGALWVATIAALISAADYYRHFNRLLAVRAMPPRETRDKIEPAVDVEPAREPAEKHVRV
jgi:CDP-diacylglycerol--glycerol-3-phosphate 3-phosphatidyltransferase